MTDNHEKTEGDVHQVTGRLKGIFKESDHGLGDLVVGPREYDKKSGTGSISAETDKVKVEITVIPKEKSDG